MWASVAEVAPIRLPGYWIHEPGSTVAPEAPLMPGEKIIYALHGGGYTIWSAHPAQFPGHAARGVIQHAACVHRTFSIEYRLSSTTPFAVAHPFPTALIDALTGYPLPRFHPAHPPRIHRFHGRFRRRKPRTRPRALLPRRAHHLRPSPLPVPSYYSPPGPTSAPPHETPNSSLITCAASDFLAAPHGPPARPQLPPLVNPRLHRTSRARHSRDKPVHLSGIAPPSTSASRASRAPSSAGEAEILRDSIRTLNERISR
ncbi:hypothetical protein B0H14DRAFT_3160518 [Mycena olivaceomarginata]|nr:hypothetical protein B0H14DRAFT_3160518 [Mycena olivaceomarginata]